MKGNGTLETSGCEKGLGVYVHRELHRGIASNTGNRIMGMIRRSFTCIDKEMFLCLFRRRACYGEK